MSLKELQNKYKDVFGMSTKVHNKDWILYKIGERTPPESTDEEVPASPGNDSPQKPVANATAAPPRRVRAVRSVRGAGRTTRHAEAAGWWISLRGETGAVGTMGRTGGVRRLQCLGINTARNTCGGPRVDGRSNRTRR